MMSFLRKEGKYTATVPAQRVRRISGWVVLLALPVFLLLPRSDAYGADPRLQWIQNNPEALRSAELAGRKASFFCVNCHGESGVSKLPEVPNLAGQNADYILEQTRKFGDGRRKDNFMQGLIKVLTEEEKMQIALFYASQNVRPDRQHPADKLASGKRLFMQLCSRCHGLQARGGELYPRLAGQHVDYIKVSVARYRDRTGERNDPQMFGAVALLKDEQIDDIAAYVSSLP